MVYNRAMVKVKKDTKPFDYVAAQAELNDLLDWFESGNTDLDKALINYKRAVDLISQIEAYLLDTEAKLQISIQKNDS